jgi:hypothetical protein
MLKYELFVEKINWGKPFEILKNIFKLEKPNIEIDDDGDEVEVEKEDEEYLETPNDIVELTTTFQISILRPDTEKGIIKAVKMLMNNNNLEGDVYMIGSMKFKIEAKGKRIDADSFYNKLRKALK